MLILYSLMKKFENLCKQILEACWKGYKQVSMKKKGKRKVPNCVPK